MRILSTKKLNSEQRSQLKSFDVEEVPMIAISYGENFKVDEKIENAVFTSANSVRSVFEIHKTSTEWFGAVYCVGQKTKYILEKFGLQVEEVANNAMELADTLAELFSEKQDKLKEISWFCGNLRNNDLPSVMAENGVLVTEYLVYETKLTPVKIESAFDGVLFFSPSGVKSYIKAGNAVESTAFCIGNTTAAAAIMEFEKVYVADAPSVEAVIQSVNENLK